MPYTDPLRKKQYNAKYNKKKRAEALEAEKNKVPTEPFKLKTVGDLVPVIEETIDEILTINIEPDDSAKLFSRARVIAQLVKTALDILQTGELESRMQTVEEQLGITANLWR